MAAPDREIGVEVPVRDIGRETAVMGGGATEATELAELDEPMLEEDEDGLAADAEVDAAETAVVPAGATVRGRRRAPNACFGLGLTAGRAAAVPDATGCPFAALAPGVDVPLAAAADGRTPRRFGGMTDLFVFENSRL